MTGGPPAPPGGCGDSVRQFAHSVHVRFGARAVGWRLGDSEILKMDGVLCVCVPWSPNLGLSQNHSQILGYPNVSSTWMVGSSSEHLGSSLFEIKVVTAWMRCLRSFDGLWVSKFGCKTLQDHRVSKSSVLDDLVTPLSNLETPHQSRYHCH